MQARRTSAGAPRTQLMEQARADRRNANMWPAWPKRAQIGGPTAPPPVADACSRERVEQSTSRLTAPPPPCHFVKWKWICKPKSKGGFGVKDLTKKRKYHFIKWKWICKHKSKGGLGVKDLTKFNISFICKMVVEIGE
jgi:hypothetical protein